MSILDLIGIFALAVSSTLAAIDRDYDVASKTSRGLLARPSQGGRRT